MKEEIIKLKGVKKIYGEGRRTVKAVNGIDLSIKEGEITAIMGPSGAGKTTLLNIIGALEKATEGIVVVRGTDLGKLNERGRSLFRRANIGFIFQTYNLIPSLTALENVLLPLLFSPNMDEERGMELLKMVGLGDRWDHLPRELSGGEKQRVAIARSLIRNPSIILADEPTGNIDTAQSRKIMKILKNQTKGGKAVVVATHDPLVVSFCSRQVRIRDGRIIGV